MLRIRKAKPTAKWGRKATGPAEAGSRVARGDHCIGYRGNTGFFLGFQDPVDLGDGFMKQALVPVQTLMMVPNRVETSMAVMTNTPRQQDRGSLRPLPSSHQGITRRQSVKWTYHPGPKITGKLIDIYA